MRVHKGSLLLLGLLSGAVVHAGCGGGDTGSTGTSSTGATSSSTATGAGGGATSSASATSSGTGTGGSGGGMMGMSFDSHGTSSYETEGTVAANANGDVVAAWLAFFADGSSAVGYAISHDTGATWTAPAYVKSPGGLFTTDPVVTADSQKRFSLTWLGFGSDFNMPDEHVFVSRLEAGAGTFNTPVSASDDGVVKTRDYDKPWITVDANDNVLVTWADFTGSGMGTPPSLTLGRSTDGTTFNRTTIVSDATFGNLAYPCLDRDLGPTAPLYVVHTGAGSSLVLRKSTDQGKSWMAEPVSPSSVIFQDVTCAAHGSEVWIAYATGTGLFTTSQNPPGDAVKVIHSADGGATFDAPVTVSAGPAGSQYLFPQLMRTAAGTLAIAYYQGTEGNPADLVLSTSPSGASWTASKVATAGTFTVDRTKPNWLGDYLGIAAADKSIFLAFGDSTNGKARVSFKKVDAP